MMICRQTLRRRLWSLCLSLSLLCVCNDCTTCCTRTAGAAFCLSLSRETGCEQAVTVSVSLSLPAILSSCCATAVFFHAGRSMLRAVLHWMLHQLRPLLPALLSVGLFLTVRRSYGQKRQTRDRVNKREKKKKFRKEIRGTSAHSLASSSSLILCFSHRFNCLSFRTVSCCVSFSPSFSCCCRRRRL